MKVAQIVSSFPPYYGGMGNVVFQMSAELIKRGHEVVVLTPDYYEEKEIKTREGKPEQEHVPELEKQITKVQRLRPSFRYGNAARLPQLGRELAEFDVVHLHYPFFGTANIVRKWKLKNPQKQLVITYHMDPRGLGWLGMIFKLYARYYSHKILNLADKVICSSFDYVKASEAGEIYKNNQAKWLELPFGVDIEKFKPREKPLALFQRYDLDPDLPLLLFVGGMDKAHYFKGVPMLLEALLILKRQKFSLQTLLVGGGELQENFVLRAKGFGLDKFVKFAGYVSQDELPYHYNLADLFVLPSIHRGEAFGMVLLEAMSSGVPVIASDLPGVRTLARDGGTVFETGNARDLAESIYGFFINDVENQLMWRGKVREAVEKKYSWPIIVDVLERVYKEFAEKSKI